MLLAQRKCSRENLVKIKTIALLFACAPVIATAQTPTTGSNATCTNAAGQTVLCGSTGSPISMTMLGRDPTHNTQITWAQSNTGKDVCDTPVSPAISWCLVGGVVSQYDYASSSWKALSTVASGATGGASNATILADGHNGNYYQIVPYGGALGLVAVSNPGTGNYVSSILFQDGSTVTALSSYDGIPSYTANSTGTGIASLAVADASNFTDTLTASNGTISVAH